ncbi:MAG: elongation factor G [Lentisphaerae bacterium]|nr:elongation factor G [Lentisphaerota bacterium]
MKVSVDKIRNFAVAGHTSSGKTTLCDLMLFKAKAVERLGSVDHKTSVSDYTPDEQEKLSSIYATALNCAWNNHQFFFLDTPGYGEFIGETIAAIHSSDAVLLVVDGVTGLEIGTSKAWTLAKERNLPRMFFINRLDRELSDFNRVLEQIQEAYGKTLCIPITVPVGREKDLSKVVSVLSGKDIPDDIAADVASYREKLMDAIAEADEDLMVRYLEGQQFTEEEIAKGLNKAIGKGTLVPVFAGSASKDIGVTELMDAVASLFPNPLAVGEKEMKDGKKLALKEDGPGTALVFKSIIDPFIGHLNFYRVYSGKFIAESEMFNRSTREKERYGSLMIVNGKIQTPVTEALPGFIVAVAKLKSTKISNTLSTVSGDMLFEPIPFPNPVMSYAVTAVKAGEEEKIMAGLIKITDSDPTIKLERNDETHEQLLRGMGDQHIHQVVKKLKNNNKIEVHLSSPKIPYRETITSNGEGQHRHKKQSGGHGQFAEVFLRVSPNPAGFEFVNYVFGGSIPKNYIPAVEKGVREAMVKGPLAGCHVENMTVAVYDGKDHDVDSSEMAFKIASRAAFKKAMQLAKPILLEPIQKVKIMVPSKYMGDITGDLNHRRGHILGINIEEGMEVVNAEVPLAEMARYASELRSLTQGCGSFEMEFARYNQVPSILAKQIIENYNKTVTEEEE